MQEEEDAQSEKHVLDSSSLSVITQSKFEISSKYWIWIEQTRPEPMRSDDSSTAPSSDSGRSSELLGRNIPREGALMTLSQQFVEFIHSLLTTVFEDVISLRQVVLDIP